MDKNKSEGTSEYSKMVKWEQRLQREEPLFKEIINSISNETVHILDIGCGTGEHLRFFTRLGKNITGVGIDIEEENVNKAREKTKMMGLEDKLDFKKVDMRELDTFFTEDTFDFTLCIGNSLAVFTEEERRKIFDNIFQVCKPRGKIFFQVVNYHAHDEDTEWFYSPTLNRNIEGKNELVFYLRMMEWTDDDKQEVTMYVQKIIQEESKSEIFTLETKKTTFAALEKKNFENIVEKNDSITFYGDFSKSEFNRNKSNDIIVLITKQ